jgi:hypothetical protein
MSTGSDTGLVSTLYQQIGRCKMLSILDFYLDYTPYFGTKYCVFEWIRIRVNVDGFLVDK